MMCMAGMSTHAQTETLLTTITATAREQASYSTANVATVSFSYTTEGSSVYTAIWGWWGYGWIATVTPADGYTITRCVFYDDANRTATDSEAPFVVETTEEDKTPKVNGTPILANQSKGIKKIEVYGYVTPTTVDAAVQVRALTRNAEGNWVLNGMPDFDGVLQMTFYEQYRLEGRRVQRADVAAENHGAVHEERPLGEAGGHRDLPLHGDGRGQDAALDWRLGASHICTYFVKEYVDQITAKI